MGPSGEEVDLQMVMRGAGLPGQEHSQLLLYLASYEAAEVVPVHYPEWFRCMCKLCPEPFTCAGLGKFRVTWKGQFLTLEDFDSVLLLRSPPSLVSGTHYNPCCLMSLTTLCIWKVL
jgi:hypothetical protein